MDETKMFPVPIKSEVLSHGIAVCTCCLTSDRILQPLGKYSDVFHKIMLGKTSVISTLNTKNMLACWECIGILKKVLEFRARTENAQVLLQLSELQNMIYPSLSTLNTTVITEKSYYSFNYNEDLEKIKKSDQITETVDEKLMFDIKIDLAEEIKQDEDIAKDSKEIKLDLDLNNIKNDNFDDYEDLVVLDEELFENEKKHSKKRKYDEKSHAARMLTAANKFRKIKVDRSVKNYELCQMNHDETLKLMEKTRKSDKEYLRYPYKCESCVVSYKYRSKLRKHNQAYHSKSSGPAMCDICKQRFLNEGILKSHYDAHFTKYVCKICKESFFWRTNCLRHLCKYHTNIYVCKKCDQQFQRRGDFYEHYKQMHQLFICDHCGRSAARKQSLINHIRRRHMVNLSCDVCRKTFRNVRNVRTHMRMFHTRSEAYCVECDLTLPNIELYKRHLRSSVKHKPAKKQIFPCPECGKEYARRCSMNYHYKYVHQQETKFKCDECDRYFLNGFRLRTHKKATHDKIPPEKTKMCTICGRGFSTNRILENHIRTHTGERPHVCPHCPAAFAQRTAMCVHIRNIHTRTQS